MKIVLALSCFLSSSILSSCSSITDSHSVRRLVREVSSFCSPSSWDLGRKRGKEGWGGEEEMRGRNISHQCEALNSIHQVYLALHIRFTTDVHHPSKANSYWISIQWELILE